MASAVAALRDSHILGRVVQDKAHLTMQTAPACRNKQNKRKTSFSSTKALLTYHRACAACALSKCSISDARGGASTERSAGKDDDSFPLPVCSGWCLDDLSVPAEKYAQGPVLNRVAKTGEDPFL